MLKRIKRHHDFMWHFTRSLILSLARPVFVYLFFISLTLISFFSFIFYEVEAGKNANVTGYFDAFYYGVTVMTTVGLGDIHPMTIPGRIISIFMMLTGTAIYVSFTATLATSIMELEMNHRKDFKKSKQHE